VALAKERLGNTSIDSRNVNNKYGIVIAPAEQSL